MNDAIDNQILTWLIRDGRASFSRIGAHVGLSPHAVGTRVRKLCEGGTIKGFTAVIDEEHTGRSLDAVVDVRVSASVKADQFEKDVETLVSVRRWAFLTGRADYSVWLSCRDTEELDDTVRAIRALGAIATETRIVMRSKRLPPRP